MDQEFVESKSGAKSSSWRPRYDLIPLSGLRRLAERYGSGAKAYGEWNWQKGIDDPEYVRDRLNHAIEHLILYAQKNATGQKNDDDDLAAAAWGCFFLMEVEERKNIEDGTCATGETPQTGTPPR